MIIIIVAVLAAILIDVYVTLRQRIRLIRAEEMFIYDTIFLREFFQYINSSYDWKDFFSRNHQISVTRIVSWAKASAMNVNFFDAVYVETKGKHNFAKGDRWVYCLEYDFAVDTTIIKLYTFLPCICRGLLSKIKNTTFSIVINSDTRKMNFIDSFADKIHCVSKQTVFQGLAFALESRVQRFKDSLNVFDFVKEFRETRSIGFKVLERWQLPS